MTLDGRGVDSDHFVERVEGDIPTINSHARGRGAMNASEGKGKKEARKEKEKRKNEPNVVVPVAQELSEDIYCHHP